MDYKIQKMCVIKTTMNEEEQYYSYRDKLIFQVLLLQNKKILIIMNMSNIQILNQNTFKLFSTINNDNSFSFFSATQLKLSGHIACCQTNGDISIYKVKPSISQKIQTISVLNSKTIYRIKEITNNLLVSCQDEKSLIFYEYNNNRLNISDKLKQDCFIESLQPTKNMDVLLYGNFFFPKYNYKIILFNAENKKKIKTIVSKQKNGTIYEPFCFLSKNIIAIIIFIDIFLVDINNDYSLITKFEDKEHYWINSICAINFNIIITGDDNGLLHLLYFDDKKNIITKIDEYIIYECNEKDDPYTCEKKKKAISLVKLNSNSFLLGGGGKPNYLLNAFNIKNLKAEETIIKNTKKQQFKKEEEDNICNICFIFYILFCLIRYFNIVKYFN